MPRALFFAMNTPASTLVYDADAQSFFTRYAIANGGVELPGYRKEAINNFVVTLKSAGIWSKITEMYIFVGGTAATHALAFKSSSRDITWVGMSAANHTALGVDFNGTTQYGNTGMLSNAMGWSNQNLHIGVFVNENGPVNGGVEEVIFGQHQANNSCFNLSFFSNTGTSGSARVTQTAAGTAYSMSDTRGFHLGTRTSSTLLKSFVSGALVNTSTVLNAGAFTNSPMLLGAAGTLSTPNRYSDKRIAFATVGAGLTDAEAVTFSQAVQLLQTYLGH